MKAEDTDSLKPLLKRALSKRCPQCGEGEVLHQWIKVNDDCSNCGMEFRSRAGNCSGFMYLSTAGLIGVPMILGLLFPPKHAIDHAIIWLTCLLLVVLTLPYRKVVALAIDLYVDNNQPEKKTDKTE